MYPFLRLAKEFAVHRNAPSLGLFDTHVSRHICWPWDLDLWMELNNGRTLTLFDLGRTVLAQRTGLAPVAKAKGWGITVAGSTTRYRRRITVFDRLEMRSRAIGWDERFFYLEQGFWRGEDCASHMLIRIAVVAGGRMVPVAEAVAAMGGPTESPPLPDWVAAWAQAEALRPWPPMEAPAATGPSLAADGQAPASAA